MKDIQAVTKRIENFTVSLTTDERKHTTKFRTGGEAIVELLGRVSTQQKLALPGITVDGMNADLTLAQRLAPLAAASQTLAQRLDDTILEAQSECWWAATALYTALARVSAQDAKVEKELAPAFDFFAKGRRRRAAPPQG